MNLKKKLRSFFTLSRRANDGFTLVELIVVIAILAILAGVAVPAYSGYVKKANEAADQQLLGAINTAFAAACAINGESHIDRRPEPTATISREGVVEVVVDGGVIDTAFGDFYKGGQFKVINKLYYTGSGFAENVEVSKTVNGVTYTASASDIAKYQNTTWYSEMTTEELLNTIVDLKSAVQDEFTGAFNTMINDPGFKASAEAALGLEAGGYDAYIDKLLKEKYPDGSAPDMILDRQRAEYEKELQGNIAVVVAAQNAGKASSGLIANMQANGGADVYGMLASGMDNNPSTGLSQAALAYGLYHSYVYSRDDLTDAQKKEEAEKGIALDSFTDTKFQEYLGSQQAQDDLDGMVAALNVAKGQSGNAVNSVVTNGLNNPDLLNALGQMLGK